MGSIETPLSPLDPGPSDPVGIPIANAADKALKPLVTPQVSEEDRDKKTVAVITKQITEYIKGFVSDEKKAREYITDHAQAIRVDATVEDVTIAIEQIKSYVSEWLKDSPKKRDHLVTYLDDLFELATTTEIKPAAAPVSTEPPTLIATEDRATNELTTIKNTPFISVKKLAFCIATTAIGMTATIGSLVATEADPKVIALYGGAVAGVGVIAAVTKNLEASVTAFVASGWMLFKTAGVAQGESGGGEQGLAYSQVGLGVLLGAWVLRKVMHRDEPLYKMPINTPIAAYLGVSIVSTANSLLFPATEVLNGLIKTTPISVNIVENGLRVLALGGLLLVANTVTEKSKTWMASAFVAAGSLLFLTSFDGAKDAAGKAVGTFASIIPGQGYGAFPQMLAASAMAALALSGIGKKWQQGAMGLGAATIFGTALGLHTEWVSGWISGGIALAIVAYNTNKKVFWGAAGTIAIAAAANFEYVREKVYDLNFYAGGKMSWGTASLHGQQIGELDNDRLRMLKAAFNYAKEFLLGTGVGNYKNYNAYFGSEKVWNSTTFTSAHGTYAQALSETGWLGLGALIVLQGTLLTSLYKCWKAMPEKSWEKPWLLATYAGTWGMTVATFLGDYVFPAYHNGGMNSFGGTMYTWLFAGLGLGIARTKGLMWQKKDATPSTVVGNDVAPWGPLLSK